MQAIDRLPADEARRLEGLLFDLDDTLLDGGRLSECAYSALFRLRESGLKLWAVTGRPSGWGALLMRQWPIDGIVTENGAITLYREGERVKRLDSVGESERRERRARLARLASELQLRFEALLPADDVDARSTDFSFDIGEFQHPATSVVNSAAAFARERGFRTYRSSVHLHVTLEADDKASGAVRSLRILSGVDATRARLTYAFIGDSENDTSCFTAFRTTIGVANLTGRLTVPPRFVTQAARGAGFAEAAAHLVKARSHTV